MAKKTSIQTKVSQAQASWGGLLYPIGIFFPALNSQAASVTSKIPVVGSYLAAAQKYTGVTTEKNKTTKKKQSSKKAKKATKNKKR